MDDYRDIDREELNRYKKALRRAAEELYENEVVLTDMEHLMIREVAEKYDHFMNEEKNIIMRNCIWATKEEWIEDTMNCLLDQK